jgi:hypothetical protein
VAIGRTRLQEREALRRHRDWGPHWRRRTHPADPAIGPSDRHAGPIGIAEQWTQAQYARFEFDRGWPRATGISHERAIHMLSKSRLAFALIVGGLLACTARVRASSTELPTTEALSAGLGPGVARDLALLRKATQPYHDLSVAQGAGYPIATPACIADSTMGGMGHHYFDRAVYDDTLKIEHPEMLIYAPRPGNKMKLVAVEYVIPFRTRPATAVPPRLFGQELHKHDKFQYWYLHVWAWERNPAGLFADWNPAVTCP